MKDGGPRHLTGYIFPVMWVLIPSFLNHQSKRCTSFSQFIFLLIILTLISHFFRQKVDLFETWITNLQSPIFARMSARVLEQFVKWQHEKSVIHKQDFHQQHFLRWTNNLCKERKCTKEEFLTPCSVQCPTAYVVREPTQKASLKCVKQMHFVVDGFVHLLV